MILILCVDDLRVNFLLIFVYSFINFIITKNVSKGCGYKYGYYIIIIPNYGLYFKTLNMLLSTNIF